MGIWAEIKMALNSTLGRGLKPLDVIVKESQHDLYYSQLEKDVINGATNIFLYPRGTKKIGKDESLVNQLIVGIPVGAEKINDSAFSDKTIKCVLLPMGITSIGSFAFHGCSNLMGIEIPDSVTSIGNYAFSACTSLVYNEYDNAYYLGNENNPYVVLVKAKDKSITSCEINSNTKFIYGGAFSDCSSLTSIVIPDSVTSIGDEAFKWCSSLTDIYYKGNKSQWNLIEFGTNWNSGTGAYTIHCADGDITKG